MDLGCEHVVECLDEQPAEVAKSEGEVLLEKVMKPFEVRHEVLHGGRVSDHLVGRYSTRWGAWLAAHWHALVYLGPYDYVFALDHRTGHARNVQVS